MSVFKCKMCGGTIEFEPGATVGICDSCGTKQTLPRLDDDRRANLYDRANHFRRNNEFDKAAGIYERILTEDTSDAEAYWSLVLCRYGIEYVEDPATHKRVPTVNRAQFTSVFDDDNYKSALQHADSLQRILYEQEAATINEIQKGILAISQKEEPFDVFICYKETDQQGRRTQDSVLANDLYHQLTREGFKVFFSRITLEDKLGTAYEPYIFAALNSARVMVVLGTRPEHFNAVWVKNEWSRYLSLVRDSGGKKVLIPAYRDMDPYDLPEEFSHLQAQDMSKLGFMQDLIRGIKKLLDADRVQPAVKETVVVQNAPTSSVEPLLTRAFMYLEDGDWQSADEYCERVLDQEPKNARAYLGKLMAELRVRRQGDLANYKQPFDNNNNYQKAVRFGNAELAETLNAYTVHIKDRNETARLAGIYDGAVQTMNQAHSEAEYMSAVKAFQSIPGFKDSDTLAEQCVEMAEIARKDAIYDSAIACMTGNKIDSYEAAIKAFQSITGWKDSDEQIQVCLRTIKEIRAKEKADRVESERKEKEAKQAEKKRNTVIAIVAVTFVACLSIYCGITKVVIPNKNYSKAIELQESGDYDAAIEAFEALKGYKDSEEQASECKYLAASELKESKNYDAAIKAFGALGSYKDSEEQMLECKYDAATELKESGDYRAAIEAFDSLDYKDSSDQAKECKYAIAEELYSSGKAYEAAKQFWEIRSYSDAEKRSNELWDRIASRSSIAAGSDYTIALKSNGTVRAAGDNFYGVCDVTNWRNIVAVSAGDNLTVGLKSDGTVVAVGNRDSHPTGVSDWNDIVAVSAGYEYSVGLKMDGTVVAVGDTTFDYGQLDVSSWKGIVAVSAGGRHTVGLKSDGTVVATGENDDGECNVSDWKDIVAVSAGYDHTVGLRADGTVVAVGRNADGQCDVKKWKNIVAVSASYHTVGLCADGTVVAVGSNKDGRSNVKEWKNIVAVSAGRSHTLGLRSDGTMVAVGYKGYKDDGRCNVKKWKDIKVPE